MPQPQIRLQCDLLLGECGATRLSGEVFEMPGNGDFPRDMLFTGLVVVIYRTLWWPKSRTWWTCSGGRACSTINRDAGVQIPIPWKTYFKIMHTTQKVCISCSNEFRHQTITWTALCPVEGWTTSLSTAHPSVHTPWQRKRSRNTLWPVNGRNNSPNGKVAGFRLAKGCFDCV